MSVKVRNDELRKLLRKAKKAGWRARHTGSGHIVVIAPSGKKIYLPSTPRGGCRSLANVRAELKREGLDV
jgi:hypothetical protein